MFSDGTVIIGTGSDDLREGSRVLIRIHMRGRPPMVFNAAAGGERFPDRTVTAAIPWGLQAIHNPPVNVNDVERIEVAYVPDRRDLMHDDQWAFQSLTLTVNDSAGPVTLYDNASIAHKFERAGTWNSGVLPSYTVIGSSIIQVRDEEGARVSGAEVFVDSALKGVTNETGELRVSPAIAGSEKVVVRKRIHEQEYYRGNHDYDSTQNWNYRVYLTNLMIDNRGFANPSRSPAGSLINVILRRDSTLIGLNILVSTEWDLDTNDLTQLTNNLQSFSSFLYNATDGQFFMEVLQISDRRDLWDDSDFRVFTDANYRANVPNVTGGFLGWNIAGSAMKMSRMNDGATYAHEFGHFGLAVSDEYRDGDSSVSCSSRLNGRTRFRSGTFQTSCMMWNQNVAPKICSSHWENPHSRRTRQGEESCWQTILRRYNIDPRWNLRSPLERGAIPSTIRYWDGAPGVVLADTFMAPVIQRRMGPDQPGLLGSKRLVVTEETGAPITGVIVNTQDGSGRWARQGMTNSVGQLRLSGLHAGDRLRLDLGGGVAVERDIPFSIGSQFTVRIPL